MSKALIILGLILLVFGVLTIENIGFFLIIGGIVLIIIGAAKRDEDTIYPSSIETSYPSNIGQQWPLETHTTYGKRRVQDNLLTNRMGPLGKNFLFDKNKIGKKYCSRHKIYYTTACPRCIDDMGGYLQQQQRIQQQQQHIQKQMQHHR